MARPATTPKQLPLRLEWPEAGGRRPERIPSSSVGQLSGREIGGSSAEGQRGEEAVAASLSREEGDGPDARGLAEGRAGGGVWAAAHRWEENGEQGE
jgi:hypothetical protein